MGYDTILMIPLLLYRHYGNKRVLEQHYDGIKNWVNYLKDEAENLIVKRSYYGDWAPPIVECERQSNGDGAIAADTPGELVSTAYFYMDVLLFSEISGILGRLDDAAYYGKLAADIKEAFNRHFFNEDTYNYAKGSQASNSLALKFGLVPEGRRQDVLKNLMKDIVEYHDYHLSTGNQCTKHMMEALADNGQVEVVYRVVTQETYPGWGFMISNGATTIWERWEYDLGSAMNSRNHPMHANIGSWFYKYLAGINVDESGSGFDKISIKPCPARDLTYVNASLRTIKGVVEVKWTNTDDAFALELTIPANSTAKIFLPLLNEHAEAVTVKESNSVIWTDDRFIEGTEGVFSGNLMDEHMMLHVGSGTYNFRVERN